MEKEIVEKEKLVETIKHVPEEKVIFKEVPNIQEVIKKEIVYVRQIVMYILREYFNISYPAIGKEIGGRDHTTVIHSYERVVTNLKEDPNLQQEIEQIRAILDV